MQRRSDSTDRKLRLLQQFTEAQRWDVAMSLAESVKDSLQLGRAESGPPDPLLPAAAARPVTDLPGALQAQVAGWACFHLVEVSETAGLARRFEPVEIATAVDAGLVGDPAREVRVARCDGGTLCEIPSQVMDLAFHHGERHFQLVFQTAMDAGDRQLFLVLFANPAAERPHYGTDLNAYGEDRGLQVENAHFSAHLSAQTWQLERLIYRGSHGLELFAGGEGHGEPPHIDWAHDYLDVDKFQKFRVTNWEEVPNLEVVRGPLCVRVRRWGFPHSPLHPVFTQSRFHIDVTYTFHAGLPWFSKRGSMEAVTDFQINYLRDDEWVFSGYSFTDSLWLDQQGRVHEGGTGRRGAGGESVGRGVLPPRQPPRLRGAVARAPRRRVRRVASRRRARTGLWRPRPAVEPLGSQRRSTVFRRRRSAPVQRIPDPSLQRTGAD